MTNDNRALIDQLLNRLKLKYAGDCKCGNCQLVPYDLLEKTIQVLTNHPASGSPAGVPEGVLTGGNHLASILIRQLGGDFSEKYPPDLDPESALRSLCATDTYDIWCAWAAIMNARNAAAPSPPVPAQDAGVESHQGQSHRPTTSL